MTLSDISQEAAISESTVNMDVVETYTEPLAAQAVEEIVPNEVLVSSETADQVEAVEVAPVDVDTGGNVAIEQVGFGEARLDALGVLRIAARQADPPEGMLVNRSRPAWGPD